jgi:hypothetical protein
LHNGLLFKVVHEAVDKFVDVVVPGLLDVAVDGLEAVHQKQVEVTLLVVLPTPVD